MYKGHMTYLKNYSFEGHAFGRTLSRAIYIAFKIYIFISLCITWEMNQ